MMHVQIKHNLPAGFDQRQFISELMKTYAIESDRPELNRMAIYDTFDWRLFNKSLVLYACGNRFFVRKLFSNEIMHGFEIKRPPVLLQDFPKGEIQEFLAPILKMRALFRLVDVHSRSRAHRILNQDEKTVARFVFNEIRSTREKESPVLDAYVLLQPVKGYPKYFRNLSKRFKEAGLFASENDDIYFKALASVDKNPGDYSSKLNLTLIPDMRSDDAARIILGSLLQVIKINGAYIAKDVDTEFLHDYRVAIRRTRSALGQIKKVFPHETTARFKKDFSFLGKLSNQLRDLDVYLLKKEVYKGILPVVLRDDIDPLFNYLRKKRLNALKQVVSSFKSEKYRQILHDWESFLNEPQKDAPTTSNADLRILTLAQKRIYKKYGSIVEASSRALETLDDEKLHALRIECKKLRYLMEFFSSLFPRKKINVLIKQLKKLQNKLGNINDLRVQQQYLLHISEKLPATNQKNKKAVVAIGALIGSLDTEKRMLKNTLPQAFENFASPDTTRIFGELFSPKYSKEVS
ncbi:Adenylate cyclase (EC [Olavius algarvensis associated proteobacterium Delta 3]|nr:Adenylate cyclase (EC [Olavius algarvensis associated proteobacterium Delta 3]CAB5135109.1 Adenylate cyclase (EC [Olavius algarvensis associated proteobacterium Delta 3]